MTGGTSVNPELIIKQLREEQEINQQFIYEYKKKLHRLEILETEYQEEIERLKQDKINIESKLETKIVQFQEEKYHLKNSNNEEMQILQKDVAELLSENERLKMEFDSNKMSKSLIISEDASTEDVEELKDKIRELENTIESLNIQLNQSQKQCIDLEEMNQIIKNENEGLKENFNLKREELCQANELIQDLQDNIMCLRAEVDSMKNKPLDEQSRGNSLFAEVNDSRVQLVKKMKILMTKYNEMAKERENLLRENESLRNNKATMIQLIETDIEEYRPGNQNEIDAHKSTIAGLRKLIESYKEEITNLKKSDNSESSKDLIYYESSLKCREKEIQSLRQTLDTQSTTHILKARKLSQLGREMVNWKWKATQFENQVETLTRKVRDLKGFNKELHKSKDIDEKQKENEIVNVNISTAHDEKRHILKEKPVSENMKCEIKLSCEKSFKPERKTIKPEEKTVIPEEKIVKPEEKTVKTEENILKPEEKTIKLEEKIEPVIYEAVIDLTEDSDETGPKKTVHFSENTKQESENIILRKGPVVVRTHLPITSFRKTNLK